MLKVTMKPILRSTRFLFRGFVALTIVSSHRLFPTTSNATLQSSSLLSRIHLVGSLIAIDGAASIVIFKISVSFFC